MKRIKWTKDEENIIKDCFAKAGSALEADKMATRLLPGRSLTSVTLHRLSMRIKKTTNYSFWKNNPEKFKELVKDSRSWNQLSGATGMKKKQLEKIIADLGLEFKSERHNSFRSRIDTAITSYDQLLIEIRRKTKAVVFGAHVLGGRKDMIYVDGVQMSISEAKKLIRG